MSPRKIIRAMRSRARAKRKGYKWPHNRRENPCKKKHPPSRVRKLKRLAQRAARKRNR